MNTQRLDIVELNKGMFVLIDFGENYFEIGIIKESILQINHKELKILVLTEAAFESTSLAFNASLPPFLPNPFQEEDLDTYPLYSIEPGIVIDLLSQQKQHYLHNLPEKQSELEAFEKLEEFLIGICISK